MRQFLSSDHMFVKTLGILLFVSGIEFVSFSLQCCLGIAFLIALVVMK